jgi:two-component system chemotaxis response regulator CheY
VKSCLIVDDSGVIRKVARRILEDLGLSVSEAEDGASALDACHETMPDGILLDWNLPVMSGVEFLTALRGIKGGRGPKVVFVTSENDAGHIARAMRAGADDYMLKPFDRGIIEAKLQDVGLI